ncbi:unnamed protein product [Cylindrotheca closterium]|uniref:DUF6824 domain-containing protein n=1 Tax=Cylindrotheca closterium TaxID=2856 RepID=A0AAD2CVG4_9STRA|nr:unnamed protein product [Cylindrotheca closterium]
MIQKMPPFYDTPMLIMTDTIMDTSSPLTEIDEIQIEQGTTTGLPPTISFIEDHYRDNDDDLELDPIPIDSMIDGEGEEALVSFAASLDCCFLGGNEQNLPTDPNSGDEQTIITRNKKSDYKGRRVRTKRRTFSKIKDPNGYAVECHKNDVLLGRGGHASNNPGNLYLLQAVRMYSAEYKSLAKTEHDKVQKRAIVRHIVSQMETRGSRFLYREKKGEQWREASGRAIYEKISHMLRDK